MAVFHLVKPPSFVTSGPTLALPSVFLAGTIDMGNSIDWQTRATTALDEKTDRDVVVYNPRRDDWDSSWIQDISNEQFRRQVEWELEHIEGVDHILMHFEPTSQSPITLLELGLIAADRPERLIVSCPEGFWRRGNVQIVCNAYGIYLLDNIDDAIVELVNRIDNGHPSR